ncbi:MAG: thiamine phosphate synthase [Planctomycetota bacterium]|nr:thiamine phosphate synthase [Planctomycetota bacterium]
MSFYRLIDANGNRACEALRVLEDLARFVLDRRDLVDSFKSARHELAELVNSLDGVRLIAARSTETDVGCDVKGSLEGSRAGAHAIASANASRVAEALRAMEEVFKCVDPEKAPALERLRYHLYTESSKLILALGSGRSRQWSLCLLLTIDLCRRPWRDVLTQAIEGGCDCVQVREKSMDGGTLASHTREIIAIARPLGVSVIVNDRVDVALAAAADGVHVGQSDLSVTQVRAIAGSSLLVGVSTHSLAQAAAAIKSGADSIGIGPMFASALKGDTPVVGPTLITEISRAFPSIHHLAIGGVNPSNVSTVLDAGARGIAVSSAICGADHPREVARSLCVGVCV